MSKNRNLRDDLFLKKVIHDTRLSLVHTIDISIRTTSIPKQSMISSLGLAKIKRPFFFVSSLVRLLACAWTMILCLCL